MSIPKSKTQIQKPEIFWVIDRIPQVENCILDLNMLNYSQSQAH